MTDALETRTGLPSEFRYLEATYPRSAWPTLDIHPSAEHWLEIHNWFRAQMNDLRKVGSAWRDGRIDTSGYRSSATPQVRQLLSNLHHHHTLESTHAFPLLAAAETRMANGFALLDRDHEAIEQLMAMMALASTELIRSAEPTDLSPFAEALANHIERGTDLIGRHLWDEEEIVVPVLTLRGDSVRI